MKKLFATLCIIALCLSLVACGSTETLPSENNGTNSSVTESNTDKVSEPSNESNTSNNVNLPLTYKVPMKNVYVNAPNFQRIEQTYTELFIVHESHYVAITALIEENATDSKNAHDVVFSRFQRYMQNYEGGVNSVSVEKEETKQINGIEVYYFEGTINYGRDTLHDGYAVGYAFIMDGIPCEIIGSVITDGQEAELKEEISKIVDAMMASVRTQP